MFAGLVLGACGSPEAGRSGATHALHAAVRTTELQGTAHVVALIHICTQPDTQEAATTTSQVGDVRFQGPEATFTTTVTSPGDPTIPVPSVLVGHDLYTGLGAGTEPMWNRTRLTHDYAVFGVVTTQGLASAGASVDDGGRTMLAGRTVTEFVVHESGGSIGTTSTRSAPTVAPFDTHAWVDARGRIVQVAAVQTTAQRSPHFAAISTTTVTLSGFGEPLSVTTPSTVATG